MQKFQNHNIKEFNTFHIAVNAREFIIIENSSELIELYKKNLFKNKFFILGSGSNLLFTKDFDGAIIQIDNRGIKVVNETPEHIFVESEAGEDWDEFVGKTMEMNAYGLENLSLIPGSVGASAVQNIGAYGVEAKDFIESVEFFHLEDGKFHKAVNSELGFKYRDSIFKHDLKDKAIVTKITFKLNKKPALKLEYADVLKEIESRGLDKNKLHPKELRNLIIDIRNNKLENPKLIGNSGSFFKNPIISNDKIDELTKDYPSLKSNYVTDSESKISAGWLIEQAGWKGWISIDKQYGVSPKHALVIVNYSNAKGVDILTLAKHIKSSVKENFGVELEEEVIII
ncbi:MAG: UDP-N-acetylmuramate dehydrogenase [Candidatus Dojkabacteria bacterium]